MEREVGGIIGMGNTCKPMAVSFQCMTKFTTNKNKNLKKKNSQGKKKEASNKAESKHGKVSFHKVKFSLHLTSLLYMMSLVPTLSKCVSETYLYTGKFKF